MIQFKNINKTYNKTHKAVDTLDLDIKDGEIFGFLGPNGAGKTTTLKMLTGVIPPDCGEIHINGVDMIKNPTKAKMKFGFVPDSPDMFLRLKGIEYLNFMADMYEVPYEVRGERIKDLGEKFGLTEVLMSQIKSYSHGMRQKIIIIGAMIHNPEILILDEPMTGLDPKSAFTLKELMREHVKKGNIVLFSTHVLDVAEKICHRVGIINKGKILFCGSIADMKQQFALDNSLEKMFLELTSDE